MVHAVGTWLLRFAAGSAMTGFGALDKLVLGFFAGTGVWHLALLALGFLGLYRAPIAVILTLSVVVLSYPTSFEAMRSLRRGLRVRFDSRGRAKILLGALLVSFGLALLAVKGLYPGGGHDYYNHYFQYYRTVIERGNLWPNEVWYHFYYSKGAGLYFLAMLVTDPLAPQLVTFCFVAAAALALFAFVRRLAPGTYWPWLGAALFLALYVYTPGQDISGQALFHSNGGWGEFEKLHELNAALVVAILWATAGALDRAGKESLVCLVAAISAIVTAVLIQVTIALYLGSLFCLVAAWYALMRQWQRALLVSVCATAAGATLLLQLAINYLVTGLFSDQGLLFFWPFADVEKLYRWGVLLEILSAHYWWTFATPIMPFSRELTGLLWLSARLDLLYPLVAGGAVFVVFAWWVGRASRPPTQMIPLLVAATFMFGVLALTAGRGQPSSFFRYSSFMMPIVIAGGIVLWTVRPFKSRFVDVVVRTRLAPVAILVACLAVSLASLPSVRHLWWVLRDTAHFVTGSYSIEAAYTHQEGWAGRLPWGGIHPGARAAYEIVGGRGRIWSFYGITYCMAPGCRIEQTYSFTVTADWDSVLFGSPERAREALQASGLNYFLFWRSMAARDPLLLSSLFSQDNARRYLGIRWTDGDSVLLTWVGPDTAALDDALVAQIAAAQEDANKAFPYVVDDRWRALFQQLRTTPHPWRSLTLPW
jgi:hypothetical protein